MKVVLEHYTPLPVCSSAIRTCWDSGDKSDTVEICSYCGSDDLIGNGDYIACGSCGAPYNGEQCMGPKDTALIERVALQFKHASTIEHLVYNFHISGISRALLQELARHRLASLSVKSTRYTLKELKSESSFYTPLSPVYDTEKDRNSIYHYKRASKYLVLTDVNMVDEMSIKALENLRLVLLDGISNDKAKYCLPESYKTELAWTINARSLRNFISLRTNKSALWEIQDLANAIYNALPTSHKYLFTDCVYQAVKEDLS